MSVKIQDILINNERDSLITSFGKSLLSDRYLLENETYQGMFARIASYYGSDKEHANRLYSYISKHWFMPATPILSNGGTNRGLPISCFINESEDSLSGILDLWSENVWLASSGGGIGSYWGNLRSIGETVSKKGKTSGIIPFVKVMDSMTLAISQGSLRRGSTAAYLPINHPEIEEFLDIRRPTGGDPNRKALNIHHGVVITDAFMHAVENDENFELKSPNTDNVVAIVKARSLWVKILTNRIETGEPYMLFIDNIKKHYPESYKRLGLHVKTSNLCSEITLATGNDHLNNLRTAVCCLSSINLEYYEEWKDIPNFIYDIMKMLDNVLEDFIKKAPTSMHKAVYSAQRERSVGLGVMGFHSYLQSKMVPIESVVAKSWNNKIFKYIRSEADKASIKIAEELGSCLDAEEAGLVERFSNKLSVAPTASISVICGNSSPGIEPYAANTFTQKTLTGSFVVRNKHLVKLLDSKGKNNEEIWSSIATNEGSVKHLDFLTNEEKDVFKTAYEINQEWLIEHAADRTPYICQAQSTNVFLYGDTHKKTLHDVHYKAWKKGLKSLYYCRSTSIQRAEKVSKAFALYNLNNPKKTEQENIEYEKEQPQIEEIGNNYEECLACQ